MIGIAAVLVVLVAGGGTLFMMKKRAAAKAAAEVAAQTPPPTPVAAPEPAPPPPPPPDTTLTNDSVLDMVKEKVPTDLILSQIRSADKTNFDLSTAEVIRLTKGGVSPLIIEQLRNPKRQPLPPPAPAKGSTPQNAKQNSQPQTNAAATPPLAPSSLHQRVPIATFQSRCNAERLRRAPRPSPPRRRP